MNDLRLSPPALLLIVAIIGAGAFALGRSMPVASSSSPSSPPPPSKTASPETDESDEVLPPGHPSTAGAGGVGTDPLPAGHPPVDSVDPAGQAGSALGGSAPAQPELVWKAPARWQLVPNASKMRLATYRVPHSSGDSEDPELSITQAGGSVDANAERWIGQFDAAGQKTAKRSTRKVGALDVAIVEVRGTYSGGMGKDASAGSDSALLGAIVPMPGAPYFFKLTGPAKSVLAARAEFDGMVASLTLP